jgi:hypothetical protein
MSKQDYLDLLSSTGREGIDRTLEKLEAIGFFEAPASSRFHLAKKGGLMEHSLNVFKAAVSIREQILKSRSELEELLPMDSVIICSLLHDVCKADVYKEGIVNRKNADGFWEKHLGFQVDYNAGLPLGHGEKSVILLLSWGLALSQDEMLAIRWHMSAWDIPFQSAEHKESLTAARAKTPLVALIQSADGVATGLLER